MEIDSEFAVLVEEIVHGSKAADGGNEVAFDEDKVGGRLDWDENGLAVHNDDVSHDGFVEGGGDTSGDCLVGDVVDLEAIRQVGDREVEVGDANIGDISVGFELDAIEDDGVIAYIDFGHGFSVDNEQEVSLLN